MEEQDGLLEEIKISNESFRMSYVLQLIQDYGIFKLNVIDAAKITVLDMWFNGEFPEILEPNDFNGDYNNPELLTLLEDKINIFVKYIHNSIQRDELKTIFARKDFEGNIIDSETYICFFDLGEWLSERGYDSGDIFAEYSDVELSVQERTCDYIVYLRAHAKYKTSFYSNSRIGPLAFTSDADRASKEELQSMLMNAIAINANIHDKLRRIEERCKGRADKPLTTRQRRTLLTLFAAICKRAKLDISARGSAQRIKEMTEELGAPVDADTIKKFLDEIPDAIESRMK